MSGEEQTRVLGEDSGPVSANGLSDLSGTVLDGRYAIARLIGAGSMGDVYEATRLATGERVAVKVLKPERAHRAVFYDRFMREARSMLMVDHPGVVHIFEVGQVEDGPVYFSMELLAGEDLAAVLKKEYRLAWPRCRRILEQVAGALQAAHERGIVHRDIKPSNCLLVEDGTRSDVVKLLDFGVAKLGVDMVSKELTSAADVVGTVLYMSPEQALGKPADARSDVYAMGVMAYEMATGRVPFPGNDIFKVMSRHLRAAPKPPREIAPDLPPDAEAIILRALEKQPEDRFQSMQQLQEALARTPGGDDQGLDESPHARLGPERARGPAGLAQTRARGQGPNLDPHAPTMAAAQGTLAGMGPMHAAAPGPQSRAEDELGGFDDQPTAYFRAPDGGPGSALGAPGMMFDDRTQIASDAPLPFAPAPVAPRPEPLPPPSGPHLVRHPKNEGTERAMPAMPPLSDPEIRPPGRSGLWAALVLLVFVVVGLVFAFTAR